MFLKQGLRPLDHDGIILGLCVQHTVVNSGPQIHTRPGTRQTQGKVQTVFIIYSEADVWMLLWIPEEKG